MLNRRRPVPLEQRAGHCAASELCYSELIMEVAELKHLAPPPLPLLNLKQRLVLENIFSNR